MINPMIAPGNYTHKRLCRLQAMAADAAAAARQCSALETNRAAWWQQEAAMNADMMRFDLIWDQSNNGGE
jgi:hypothetical protein